MTFVDDADDSPCTPSDHNPFYLLKQDWDENLELTRDVHTQLTLVVMPRLETIDTRTARLEAWVEVVIKTLATLGLEGLLCELDEARGADYDAEEIEQT
jgi:hypothetical protein